MPNIFENITSQLTQNMNIYEANRLMNNKQLPGWNGPTHEAMMSGQNI